MRAQLAIAGCAEKGSLLGGGKELRAAIAVPPNDECPGGPG